MNFDPTYVGEDLFGEPIKTKASGPVAERFVIPPFTILDAKQGDWQDRKRAWGKLGIRSEVGRNAESYSCNGENGKKYDYMPQFDTGTSIFDPVVCELAYRWFSTTGDQIVDPFAGGSVRGIVAGCLGRRYHGIDLRPEQIESNREQAVEIDPEVLPSWVCGDSTVLLDQAPDADFIFSCPPYGDLEVYSDLPEDLSSMDFTDFVKAYREIIRKSVSKLKENRFACFVVGDFRDKRGLYRNFPAITIRAFHDAGAYLYNEAILATSVGSASMRVTKQFNSGRKMAKTHQNVLVFVKGDPRTAADHCTSNLENPS